MTPPTLALRLFVLTPLTVALFALTSCSSTPPIGETASSTTYQEGVPGKVVVDTYQLNATVTGIDAANRKVTLVTRDGKQTIVKCGPEIINFDQIRVGDQVRVMATAELAVSMADASAPPSESGAGLVALAPKGAKPGGLMAETQQYTATVTAIGLKRHEATLQYPDGTTHKFVVRPDVDLSQRKVGEKVVIRVSISMALSVEKP